MRKIVERDDPALRLHALARETKDARTRLEQLSDSNLVEILDTIEGLSREVGVPVEIGQALSASSDPTSPITNASFVIEATGTFAQVIHAAALLESLPLPSSLEELHLELLPAARGRSSWHMVVRLQFFTTADFSS